MYIRLALYLFFTKNTLNGKNIQIYGKKLDYSDFYNPF
jgi:hypothetical protein